MENLWTIKSYYGFLSKTGYTGMINRSRMRIDEQQMSLFQESEKIRGLSLKMQSKAVSKWLYVSLTILATLQPLCLVIHYDIDIKMPLWLLCLPLTIIWVALLISILVQWIQICQRCHDVHSLHKSREEFKDDQALQLRIKGHNTKHNTLFKMTKFVDKTTMFVQIIMFISFIPVFLKLHFVYFEDFKYA